MFFVVCFDFDGKVCSLFDVRRASSKELMYAASVLGQVSSRTTIEVELAKRKGVFGQKWREMTKYPGKYLTHAEQVRQLEANIMDEAGMAERNGK